MPQAGRPAETTASIIPAVSNRFIGWLSICAVEPVCAWDLIEAGRAHEQLPDERLWSNKSQTVAVATDGQRGVCRGFHSLLPFPTATLR